MAAGKKLPPASGGRQPRRRDAGAGLPKPPTAPPGSFAYLTARTPEALVAAARPQGRYLAGGVDLLDDLRWTPLKPKKLVNVMALHGGAEIRLAEGKCHIGTNTTLAALAVQPDIRQQFPALAEAAAEIGTPVIRQVATLGGNLAQHSRCRHYRQGNGACHKSGGDSCFARESDTRHHALFSGCACLSPVCSSLAVALAALDARILVYRGRRVVRLTVAQLYAAAWSDPAAHNSLRPYDLIVGVELTADPGVRSAYLQLADKNDCDWALVSCAAAARVEQRKLSDVRIVLGSIAPIPWEVAAANAFLAGKVATVETADRAADLMLREARPIGDNGYKIPIARALVRRTLLKLAAP